MMREPGAFTVLGGYQPLYNTHTHTPDTRSKPVVRRSLFFGLLYLLGIFKVPQNAIRVDIRVIFFWVFIEA